MEPEFIKKCPSCNNTITFKNRQMLNQSIRKNCTCKECQYKTNGAKSSIVLKRRYADGEIVANMSGAHSEVSRQKQSKTRLGRPQTEESNKKRRISCIKAGCGFTNKGRKCTEANKKLYRIQIIEKLKLTHKNFHPPYNKDACVYFDTLMLKEKIHIQHALNGGEYEIKELGYWVDGYDKENNIVYEYDEKWHYRGGKLRERDILRQNEIIDFLKCEFIRIKWSDAKNNMATK